MRELSKKEYWDEQFRGQRRDELTPSRAGTLWAAINLVVGEGTLEYVRSYNEYLLWFSVYPKYLTAGPGLKAIEVGSAPGYHLVKLHQRYGFEPYGVEYTDNGVELNRRIFAANGLDPTNVIHEDFLSDDFHQKHARDFDVVISRGFIEHFADAKPIVRRHVDLMRPNGKLFVSIPNFRGLNYLLMSILNRQNLAIHNLEIMDREAFAHLFEDPRLERLYCGYMGMFSFSLFNTRPGSPLRHVLRVLQTAQLGINVVSRIFLGKRACSSRWWSPHLLFVGRRITSK